MKKTFAIAAAAVLTLSVSGITAYAADDVEPVDVYVTISDGTGEIPLALEKISVKDIDDDNKLTINDALYCAHEEFFEGGAEAGYKSETTSWGLSLFKLWGIENNLSFGYFDNQTLASNLSDEIKADDVISAFVYTDTANYSDTFCWFDKNFTEAEEGDSLELTLKRYDFAPTNASHELPVADAVILMNGVETEFKTDAEGKVTVELDKSGKVILSAKSTDSALLLVPPVAVADVAASSATTAVTTTAEDTTTTAAETTAEAETTAAETSAATTASATTASATTAAATTAKTTAAAAATTAASAPKTGDAGSAVAFTGLFAAVAVAFTLRRKND